VTPARSFGFLLAAGAGIFLLTASAAALHVPGSIWVGTLARKDAVVALMLASGVLYGGAVWLVTSRPVPPRTIFTILAVAAALRILLLLTPPVMSSDIYRYVWDGRVQAAGINPYLYIPADPALAALRDSRIYPNINRADYAHTIYPPAAELLYAAVARIGQSVFAMKCAMLVLDAAGIAAMLRLLSMARLPASRILIYAWNPLALWAVAGDGHIDAAAIGLLGLAMWAWAARRDGVAGALLGGAILTKFLPLVVAPALWRRWGWKAPVACAVTIFVLYVCYLGAGWRVFGFLPQYTSEEGLRQGSGFWLIGALGHITALPAALPALYLLAGVACLAALAVRIAFRQRQDSDPMRLAANVAALAALTVAILSPHYPWYYAWLALPCCLAPRPCIIWLSVAPLLLYSDPFHDEILLPTAVFLPAAIIFLFEYKSSLLLSFKKEVLF
jgi:alpha-1,6-mannosyltransferase